MNKVTVEIAADLLAYPNALEVLDGLNADLIVGEVPPDQLKPKVTEACDPCSGDRVNPETAKGADAS